MATSFEGSVVSLRAELYRAVATADWTRVEALSTQIEAIDTTPAKFSFSMSSDRSPGDWDNTSQQVQGLIENSPNTPFSPETIGSGDSSTLSLRAELDRAVDRNDWIAVEALSNQILSSPGGVNRQFSDNYMILSDEHNVMTSPLNELQSPTLGISSTTFVSPQSVGRSIAIADEKSKIQSMEKMIEDENWRAITALAGVYVRGM